MTWRSGWSGALAIGAVVVAAAGLGACSAGSGELSVGQCFDDPGFDATRSIDTVDCAEPHDLEVFAVFDMPDGPYPDGPTVLDAIDAQCIPEFQRFIGTAPNDSDLDIFQIVPSEEAWTQDDDRTIVCSVYVAGGDEPVSGTLRGSAR